MNTIKKSSLLAAVSAFAVIAGFAAQPASANDWSRMCDNCGVDWHFTNRDIDLTIDPSNFDLAAISSVCADQDFVGSLSAAATASNINSGELANTASSVANVISVTGKDGKSPFAGVVDATQNAYGSLRAEATVNTASVYGVGKNLSNTATAAANVISLDTTKLAFVDAHQVAGSPGSFIGLNSIASATNVNMINGGAFDNTASSVANVISVDVSPATYTKPVVSSFNDKGKKPGHDDEIGHINLQPISLALVDATQSTFANMSSVASATNVNTLGGSFTNAATSAANVISVINHK